MFYIDQGYIRLTRDNTPVCPAEDITRAIHELSSLKGSMTAGETEEAFEDRFTPEGIDRHFQADPNFNVSVDMWREDALRSWEHLTGPELFQRYQKHAETYCWGCRDHGIDPSYSGFRSWMIRLRDMSGDSDLEL